MAKSTNWALGVLIAIALSLGGWGLLTTAALQSRVAVEESQSEGIKQRLDRIEEKIDRVLINQHAAQAEPRPRREHSIESQLARR